MNNENSKILEKVDEIIEYIEKSDNYQKYLLIKAKMKDDKEINELLEEIKRLQKILANNKSDKEAKILLEIKNQELNDIPLYRDYLNTIDEINNTFNIIENNLNKYFTDKLNN